MNDIILFLPGFIAAYMILLVGSSSPGPAVAMLLGIATAHGRTSALVASFGVAIGSVCLNLITLAGVGLLLAEAAWAMQILRLCGGAYLAYLSYHAFKNAMRPAAVDIATVAPRALWSNALSGFVLQIMNPKAIAFWLSIAAIGATTGGGIGIITAFVFGAFIISFVCHAAWAMMLSSSPVRRGYENIRRWVEATLGILFAFFAFRLATEKV